MKPNARIILSLIAVGVVGCAAGPSSSRSSSDALANGTASSAGQAGARSNVALDDIEPRVVLALGKGSSVGQAPLEAVHLYAQAQIAILDRDRVTAIDLMQKAVALDPASYELHVMLGRLYLAPTTEFNDRSIAMLEKAGELEPDHLDLQADLGRQYLAKGDVPSAMKHLRLALRTRQYSAEAPAASVAEFFLATLLRNQGYDRAALDVYRRLSLHLKSNSLMMRTNLEVAPLREHLDAIDGDIADLFVRTGQYDAAITAFAELVALNPSDFDLRSRQAHLLIVSNHSKDALTAAEDAAVRFRANAESIALLNEACLSAGKTDGAAGALSRLHDARPNDHAILFALAEVLHGDKRDADAQRVLDTAAARDPGDFETLRRRVELKRDANQIEDAARMLVEATALRPDLDAESAPLWSQLTRSTGHGRLRYSTLIALQVPAEWEASKSFWIWRLAEAAHREDIAAGALERSLKASPPFAPAYRDKLDAIWTRDDLGDHEKESAAQALAERAKDGSNAALAEELRGLSFARQQKFQESADAFSRAMDLGGKSPDLLLARANVLRKLDQNPAADALLWKAVSDHPLLREAYEDLYLGAINRDLDGQANHIINTWLAADPQGVTVRRIQAIQAQRDGRNKAAEAILNRVFNEHSDDPEAVEAFSSFYLRRDGSDRLVATLEQKHVLEPGNIAVSTALADALSSAHRVDDAARVLDAARGMALDDADLLYSLSTLYARLGKSDASEDVLAEVLKLDPKHPGASNDLGYVWADGNRNLARAEALIRGAVDAEPANISYLDSMGWILYKRGKWVEARRFFDRAIGARDAIVTRRPADPVMLDHRGDVLYRLGEKDAAALDWQQAAQRIVDMKDDADDEMKTLGTRLSEKVRLEKAGQDVNVAPVEVKSKTSAKVEKAAPKN